MSALGGEPDRVNALDAPGLIHRSTHSRRDLDKALRAGLLTRIERGAYLPIGDLVGDPWRVRRRTHIARLRADTRRLGDAMVFSHVSAALVHGLWIPQTDVVHVTQPFASNSPVTADRLVRHRRPLADDEVVEIEGLRVTSLPRTVADCVTALPPDWAMAVADSALRSLVSVHRSEAVRAEELAAPVRASFIDHLERRGPRRGCRQGREVLARAVALSESPGESRVRCIAVAGGLPAPTPQMPVPTPQGLYWADLGWRFRAGDREVIAVVEFDGRDKYAVADAMARQEFRQRAIESIGGRVARFDGNDLLLENRDDVFDRLKSLVPELSEDLRPVLPLLPAARRRVRPRRDSR